MKVRLNTWHYIGDKLYPPQAVLTDAEMGDASVSTEMVPLDSEAKDAIRAYMKKKDRGEEELPQDVDYTEGRDRRDVPLMGPVKPAPPKLKDTLPGAPPSKGPDTK